MENSLKVFFFWLLLLNNLTLQAAHLASFFIFWKVYSYLYATIYMIVKLRMLKEEFKSHNLN